MHSALCVMECVPHAVTTAWLFIPWRTAMDMECACAAVCSQTVLHQQWQLHAAAMRICPMNTHCTTTVCVSGACASCDGHLPLPCAGWLYRPRAPNCPVARPCTTSPWAGGTLTGLAAPTAGRTSSTAGGWWWHTRTWLSTAGGGGGGPGHVGGCVCCNACGWGCGCAYGCGSNCRHSCWC